MMVFQMVVDGVDAAKIEFLSVRLSVCAGGRLMTVPRLRATSVPLSTSSAHPQSIHSRWPAGYTRSLVEVAQLQRSGGPDARSLRGPIQTSHGGGSAIGGAEAAWP